MKRIIAGLAIMTLALLVAGCGSDKKKGGVSGQGGVTGVPDLVQKGDPALAAASGFVGSERCAGCHGVIFANWSKSLHNKPLKTVAELGGGIFVNDQNSNGVNDFEDGLDFNDPNFAANYGYANPFAGRISNAPILSASGGKYFIQLGSDAAGNPIKFEVQRTQGGNGFWKQRYHTKVGKSYYILPVQYDEKFKKYVEYNGSHWYSSGSTKRFTEAYGADALVAQFGALNRSGTQLGTARSWENRCAGCHQTGLTAVSQTNTYGSSSVTEAVTGYVELNIGCEACHGPGEQHVTSGGNPSLITNPERFRSLGFSGLRVANMVCGQCHSRGEGKATLSGMSLNMEFPSKIEFGSLKFPLPGINFVGNSPADTYVSFNLTTAYFGYPTFTTDPATGEGTFNFYTAYRTWYSVEGITFPTYIASKQHHQQWTDMEQGPHAPDKDFDPTCWSCHDPHKAAGDHQIKDSITASGVTVATKNDDNTLCLACHAGSGPFAGITLADVNAGGAAIANAVLNHMGDEAVMGTVTYDPTGSAGVGRCSKCHMPKTANSATLRTTVASGPTISTVTEGDIHNHTFSIMWPSVMSLPSRTNAAASKIARDTVNSCITSGCHTNNPADPEPAFMHEIVEWGQSGHADFTSKPFRNWDADGAIPSTCAKCHTKSGFIDYSADGAIASSATFALGHVISCGTCHISGASGRTRWDARTTGDVLDLVTFPSGSIANLGDASNICMTCHQGRASKKTVDDDIAANPGSTSLGFENVHFFAAAATFFGTDVKGGYEYDGKIYVGRNTFNGQMQTRDTCIECHMDTSNPEGHPNHTFFPEVGYCTACHPVLSFKAIRFTPTDFDGDGNVAEGIFNEIWDTLVPALSTAIRNYSTGTPAVFAANGSHGVVYSPATSPYFLVDTNDNGIADATEKTGYKLDAKLLRGAYNFQVVQKEPAGYIHNARYHIQLLIDSISDLTSNPTPTNPTTGTAFVRP